MFCPKCGTNFEDGAKFCPECGFKVPQNAANENQAVAAASTPQDAKKSNKKLIITLLIIGGVLLVALAVCLIVFFVINNKVSANLNLVIANYSDAKCTRIPVNVEGNNVDETMFVNERGEGLQLKNGDYEFSFPASPLCESGNFWTPPTNKIKMTLKDGKFEDFDEKKVEFKDADMTKVTDSQINAAAEVEKYDPENDKDIDTYVQNTKNARNKAIQDAEAERKAAEAAMRAELAKSQIVTGTYLSDDGVYAMTVDVENLRYEIKIGGVTTVDKGYFLDAAKGIKYFHDEGIPMDGEYGKQDFIVATDREYSEVSIANRYLGFSGGKVFLWRKHDAGGHKAWETSYIFKC